MHHHLVPVPGTGRERNIVYDAGDMLQVLASCGTDLVLCGHKHVPNVWRLEDMLIVNAGTACSHRLRGRVRPCYNIIEIIDNNRVRVIRKEPYTDGEIVADYRGIHRRYCSWRPEGEDRTVDDFDACLGGQTVAGSDDAVDDGVSANISLGEPRGRFRGESSGRPHRRRALPSGRAVRSRRALAPKHEVVAAAFLGGTEKVDLEAGLDTYGVPVIAAESGAEALASALEQYSPDAVVDLSDEPVVSSADRFRLASLALAAGVGVPRCGLRVHAAERGRS